MLFTWFFVALRRRLLISLTMKSTISSQNSLSYDHCGCFCRKTGPVMPRIHFFIQQYFLTVLQFFPSFLAFQKYYNPHFS
ncbi:hypothetical protein CW304_21150 [Bacillus sp. UFRGS-B20]|nr:hypothetical protein CW304_21150 [Bacillus sp. UFRGS-B20]